MKFAVDRIENNIVILENIKNGEIINLDIKILPNGIKEKDIIILENGQYKLDVNEKIKRINLLREKMKRLKKEDL